jgi:hypothetical protein
MNNQSPDYIGTMMNKSISWIDQIVAFVMKYSDLFVYGFVAMMLAKVVKFNVKVGK